MFKCQSSKCSRGYVIIYALFIGIIILSLILSIYKMAVYKDMRLAQKASKYNYNEERTLERETIFNQLFISLKDKGVLSSKEDTIKCMRDNPTLVDIICGKSNSKFDNAGDLIRLEYRGSSYEDVIQYYDIRVSMNKMDFILKKF